MAEIQGVVPTDAGVRLLQNIIRSAYADLLKQISKGDISNPTRQRALMRQIEALSRDYNVDLQAWVQIAMPGYYEMGMFDSIKATYDKGLPINFDASFAHFHTAALEAIGQETYYHLNTAMQGMTRSVTRLISRATQDRIIEELGVGLVTGKTTKKISNNIIELIKSEGIEALTDKAGKQWDLDSYAEMLARTKLTQAYTSGLVNQTLESGYDMVIVSDHQSSCKICGPWQGQVLSLTGRTKGYKTLEQAKKGGLFHPNCRHRLNTYHPDILQDMEVWDANKQEYVKYTELSTPKPDNFKQTLEDYKKSKREIGIDGVEGFLKKAGNRNNAVEYIKSVDDERLQKIMERLASHL